MEKWELSDRLKNFEILSFTNETDLFEFSFSKLKNTFKVMRNGKLLNRQNLSLNNIYWMIKVRKLQLEEL